METKAQEQLNHPNVQRKLKAAAAWCSRINDLAVGQRSNLSWHYVLLGETAFYEWRSKAARLGELLEFAKLRALSDGVLQGKLALL